MNRPPSRNDKDLVILAGTIQSPPLSVEARRETGWLLRRLQRGERLSMPESEDAIVVLDIFAKTTPRTPILAIARSKARLAKFKKDELS
jgi:hypothetical protein